MGFQLEPGPFAKFLQGSAAGKDSGILPYFEYFFRKFVEGRRGRRFKPGLITGFFQRLESFRSLLLESGRNEVMVGCMTETSCAVSAAAQLSPAVDFADLDGNLLITNDLFKGMEVIDGKITLSDLPGIGLIKL